MSALAAALPAAVRERARTLGPPGDAWLDGLDDTVADLQRTWGLELGAPLEGGSEALVLPARRRDGTAAILELALPDDEALDRQARILERAAGRGYARLLARDPARDALLLERPGPSLAALRACEGRWDEVAVEALCATLSLAWEASPGGEAFPDGDAKGRALAAHVDRHWDRWGGSTPRAVADVAIASARTRAEAHDPDRVVLVHGDAHAHNALAPLGADDASGPFRLVDPDGYAAEREFDLAIQAREWVDAAFAADPVGVHRSRCERLAALTGTRADAIEQWALAERVTTALECRRIGLGAYGDRLLATAATLYV